MKQPSSSAKQPTATTEVATTKKKAPVTVPTPTGPTPFASGPEQSPLTIGYAIVNKLFKDITPDDRHTAIGCAIDIVKEKLGAYLTASDALQLALPTAMQILNLPEDAFFFTSDVSFLNHNQGTVSFHLTANPAYDFTTGRLHPHQKTITKALLTLPENIIRMLLDEQSPERFDEKCQEILSLGKQKDIALPVLEQSVIAINQALANVLKAHGHAPDAFTIRFATFMPMEFIPDENSAGKPDMENVPHASVILAKSQATSISFGTLVTYQDEIIQQILEQRKKNVKFTEKFFSGIGIQLGFINQGQAAIGPEHLNIALSVDATDLPRLRQWHEAFSNALHNITQGAFTVGEPFEKNGISYCKVTATTPDKQPLSALPDEYIFTLKARMGIPYPSLEAPKKSPPPAKEPVTATCNPTEAFRGAYLLGEMIFPKLARSLNSPPTTTLVDFKGIDRKTLDQWSATFTTVLHAILEKNGVAYATAYTIKIKERNGGYVVRVESDNTVAHPFDTLTAYEQEVQHTLLLRVLAATIAGKPKGTPEEALLSTIAKEAAAVFDAEVLVNLVTDRISTEIVMSLTTGNTKEKTITLPASWSKKTDEALRGIQDVANTIFGQSKNTYHLTIENNNGKCTATIKAQCVLGLCTPYHSDMREHMTKRAANTQAKIVDTLNLRLDAQKTTAPSAEASRTSRAIGETIEVLSKPGAAQPPLGEEIALDLKYRADARDFTLAVTQSLKAYPFPEQPHPLTEIVLVIQYPATDSLTEEKLATFKESIDSLLAASLSHAPKLQDTFSTRIATKNGNIHLTLAAKPGKDLMPLKSQTNLIFEIASGYHETMRACSHDINVTPLSAATLENTKEALTIASADGAARVIAKDVFTHLRRQNPSKKTTVVTVPITGPVYIPDEVKAAKELFTATVGALLPNHSFTFDLEPNNNGSLSIKITTTDPKNAWTALLNAEDKINAALAERYTQSSRHFAAQLGVSIGSEKPKTEPVNPLSPPKAKPERQRPITVKPITPPEDRFDKFQQLSSAHTLGKQIKKYASDAVNKLSFSDAPIYLAIPSTQQNLSRLKNFGGIFLATLHTVLEKYSIPKDTYGLTITNEAGMLDMHITVKEHSRHKLDRFQEYADETLDSLKQRAESTCLPKKTPAPSAQYTLLEERYQLAKTVFGQIPMLMFHRSSVPTYHIQPNHHIRAFISPPNIKTLNAALRAAFKQENLPQDAFTLSLTTGEEGQPRITVKTKDITLYPWEKLEEVGKKLATALEEEMDGIKPTTASKRHRKPRHRKPKETAEPSAEIVICPENGNEKTNGALPAPKEEKPEIPAQPAEVYEDISPEEEKEITTFQTRLAISTPATRIKPKFDQERWKTVLGQQRPNNTTWQERNNEKQNGEVTPSF